MLTLPLLGNQNVDSLFGVLTQWSGLKVQPFCLEHFFSCCLWWCQQFNCLTRCFIWTLFAHCCSQKVSRHGIAVTRIITKNNLTSPVFVKWPTFTINNVCLSFTSVTCLFTTLDTISELSFYPTEVILSHSHLSKHSDDYYNKWGTYSSLL